MHDGMPYGRNQGQGQGHSREVDRQSPTGLIFKLLALQAPVKSFDSMAYINNPVTLITFYKHCKKKVLILFVVCSGLAFYEQYSVVKVYVLCGMKT